MHKHTIEVSRLKAVMERAGGWCAGGGGTRRVECVSVYVCKEE